MGENHLTPRGNAPKMQVTALRQKAANCLQSRCSSQLSYVPWPALSYTTSELDFCGWPTPLVVSMRVRTGQTTWGKTVGEVIGVGQEVGDTDDLSVAATGGRPARLRKSR